MSHWISETVFDEADYRTATEMVVGFYLILHRDMAGVCPVGSSIPAQKCRITKAQLGKILDYFESIGKVQISDERTHVWLKAGIFHTLNRGKHSANQLQSVEKQLKKWQFSGVFGQNFAETVTQLYANKYSMSITIPTVTKSDTNTKPKSESKPDTQSKKLPVVVKEEIPFGEIIGHLNKVAGKNYKVDSEFNRKHIRTRWNEGNRLKDFFYVHQVKAAQWLGTKDEIYMRPQTLWGPKFEAYRNQPEKSFSNLPERTQQNLQAGAAFLRSMNDVRDGQTKICDSNSEAGGRAPEKLNGPDN